MNKKSIVAILLIIILLLIIGFMAFNQFNNSENQIKIGNATFILPDGFHEGTPNKAGDINITNGYDTKYTKQYVKNKQKNNISVHMKKFTVDDAVIYKSSITNKSNSVSYWFNYNNEVYSIYCWSANKNTDKIVTDIITSLD